MRRLVQSGFLSSFLNMPWLTAGGTTYSEKVLATATANLIAYWPLWETAGAVADNLEGTAARDGAYTGVTLNSSTGPDGKPVPLFDGANDYCEIYTASFSTAFNGDEGSAMVWAKVSGVGVWTDGTSRAVLYMGAAATNYITLLRPADNGNFLFRYRAQGINEDLVKSSLSTTSWVCYGLTWSQAAAAGNGEVKAYYNGIQEGATQAIANAWVGALVDNSCFVGAVTIIPGQVWDGYLAHAAVWTTPLTPAQMLALATV